MSTKYFKTGGITIQVQSEFPILETTFHPKFRRFEVFEKGYDPIVIHHHFQPPSRDDRIRDLVEVYKKDQWKIFKSDHAWVYHYTSIFPDSIVENAVGIMNKDYSDIHIYAENLTPELYGRGGFPALTLFNTDQMIFAKLLSDRDGLMIHSNGFNINGNGILLAGTSGSGKSTLSKMLKTMGHEILCDDRMFIRKIDDKYHIFGNWCYGSHPDVSSSHAPLTGFIFLKKGKKNHITELTEQKTIVSNLMPVMVKPMLDVRGWDKYLATLDELRKKVQFYEVEFDLSGRIANVMSRFFKNSY